jgi:transcriptional regulator with XRE-family HTH domain
MNNTLGQWIRENREAIGLSQRKLAPIISISYVHLSHLETGKSNGSIDIIQKLADYFGKPFTIEPNKP